MHVAVTRKYTMPMYTYYNNYYAEAMHKYTYY